MPLISPYIPEEWKENIRRYKYKGSDNSIFYRLCTSPLCDYIVQFIPKTITLLGLIFNLTIFLITSYYTGLNGGHTAVPPWACHLCSVLYFSYMMLDNLDGKQARRTGTSSPLGMLFDHGCDALTTFLIAIGFGTIIGLDSIIWYTLIWLMVSFPFFLNTWEAYYVGELNFPIIHGVSEGTLIACALVHASGFLGLEFWTSKYDIPFFDITLQINQIAVIAFFLFGVSYGLYSLINVFTRFKDVREDTISSLFIFVFMMFSMFIVIFYSGSELIIKHPKLLILLYGFAFAKLVGHLQLAHVAESKFMQYRKSLVITFFFLATVSILNHFFNIKIVDIDTLIIGFLIMHVIVWMHFAYYLTEELCEILGINRFDVKKRETIKKNH